MNLILTAMSGSAEGTVFPVANGECVTFGRTTAAQRSFPQDTHMSSLHFEIENFGERAELRDKHSTNGTWVNNNRIGSVSLNHGDQIRAGTTLFSVQIKVSGPSPGRSSAGAPSSSESSSPIDEGSLRVPFAMDFPPNQNTGAEAQNNLASNNPFGSGFSAKNPSGGQGKQPEHAPSASVFPDSTPMGKRMPFPASGDSPGKLLDDVHRHLDKKLNPFGDSIDFSEALGEERSPGSYAPVPAESPFREHSRVSPISDSSIIVPPEFQLPDQLAGKNSQYHFLQRRLNSSATDGIVTVVELVSREYSIQVVAHPQKIRQAIPQSQNAPLALWSCFEDGIGFGPIAIPWLDFKQLWQPFLDRLIGADAIVFFFGSDLNVMHNRLKELPLAGIPGFSEPGGFLNCFWPSSLQAILNARGALACNELFDGKFSGLLIRSPLDAQLLLAAADNRLCQKLLETGFQSSSFSSC